MCVVSQAAYVCVAATSGHLVMGILTLIAWSSVQASSKPAGRHL